MCVYRKLYKQAINSCFIFTILQSPVRARLVWEMLAMLRLAPAVGHSHPQTLPCCGCKESLFVLTSSCSHVAFLHAAENQRLSVDGRKEADIGTLSTVSHSKADVQRSL